VPILELHTSDVGHCTGVLIGGSIKFFNLNSFLIVYVPETDQTSPEDCAMAIGVGR